jgi:hypothetical protein
MHRKVGRPIGGCLTPEQKAEAVLKARQQQRQWRIDNPERYSEHIKNYREKKKSKDIDQFKVMEKFLKRIKTISIDGVSSQCAVSAMC